MSKVSVCCSVLNQKDMLKDMIGSVYLQTFKDWELIVVDDGSTDDIKAVCDMFKDERIRYVRWDENKGIPHGINHAFSLATGDYVQALAADELLVSTKLADQVEYLEANPTIEAIWGLPGNGEIGIRPDWEQYKLRAHNRSNEAWVKTLLELDNVPIGSASCLFRRELLTTVGYFDDTLTTFSDHEWFTRFFHQGHKGRILPFRWCLGVDNPKGMSRSMAPEKVKAERDYVAAKWPLRLPVVDHSVTIAIPIHNMAHWLGSALKSIYAQTVPVSEILVIDDASTDDVQAVLKEHFDPRIQYFRFEENQGNIAGNNFALSQAKGRFFCNLAADDTVDPTFVQSCLEAYAVNPWLEFCSTLTDFMDDKGVTLTKEGVQGHPVYAPMMAIAPARQMQREEYLNTLYYGNHYFGAGMYRTEALRDVGGWKKECEVIADYEMYLNLLQRGNIRVIEQQLTHTRLHEKNLSNLTANKPKRPLTELYRTAKAPYYQPRMKVIIATPFYEMKGWSPYISSLASTIKLLTMLGIEHEFWELAGDSYVARARNTICAKFLEDGDATDLFFIDSDMTWNPDAFVRMLMLPEPIVAASYPAKNMWAVWSSMPVLRESEGKVHPVGRPLQDGSALLAAETVATGFCRIKRQLLEQYQKQFPDTYKEPGADQSNPDRDYTEFFLTGRQMDGLWYGEDRMFCKRLKDMGVEMFIYPNVTMGHYGVKGWSGNYDQFLRGKKDGDSPRLDS